MVPGRLRPGALRGALLVIIAVGGNAAGAPAQLVLNELLPDPDGSDDGREFVEIFNPGETEVDLGGVALEFANGAVGAEWVVRWTGQAGQAVSPGGRFLLVDRNWSGAVPGDVEVDLGLQNGPDAIRLVRAGQVLDLVGYGALTDPLLSEGRPVPLDTGRSLARRPDGRDSGDNAADFVSAEPTPGTPNFRPHALSVAALEVEPPVLARPGDLLRTMVRLRNTGTEVLPPGGAELRGTGDPGGTWWDGAEPGAERQLTILTRPPRRGRWPLRLVLPVSGTADTIRLELGTVQVGAAGLQLAEVLPAPGDGQGEWAELVWRGPGSVALGGHRLEDADGAVGTLPPVELPAGARVVIAADSLGLVGWWRANAAAGRPGCPADGSSTGILVPTVWPTLNNTPPAGRPFADRLLLRDPAGVVLDAVAWGGPGLVAPPPGRSLERIGPEPVGPEAAAWAVCTAVSSSTPGCPNSTAGVGVPAGSAGLEVAPPLLDRAAGASTVHLRFSLTSGETAWEVRICDLWGDTVRDFGGDVRGAGPRDLLWDGRDDTGRPVPDGVYVVVLRTRLATGASRRRMRRLVVVR